MLTLSVTNQLVMPVVLCTEVDAQCDKPARLVVLVVPCTEVDAQCDKLARHARRAVHGG